MKRLEAIADSIAFVNGYYEPESRAYELRNPGLLAGDEGNRIFSCHRAGYAALLDRLEKNCKAHPDASFAWLLDSFGLKMRTQQDRALDFIGRCANSTVKPETPLNWFLE